MHVQVNMKPPVLLFGVILTYFSQSNGQYQMYECPLGWEEYADRCFRFIKFPTLAHDAAKSACAVDGAYLLAINSDGEHVFITGQLDAQDVGQIKHTWWTSGRRSAPHVAEFYWEGDGTTIESFVYWQNSSIPTQEGKDHISYYYDGYKWGWILDTSNVLNAYVCEISKEDIYKISQEDRGPGYGVDNPDPLTVERGPKIITQPMDTVYEPKDARGYTYLDCYADAYPGAYYEWRRERAGENITIDPSKDERYTLVNGRLLIHDPSPETQDDGKYQCNATNKFGTVKSNTVSLGFGYLQDFPKSPRAPVEAIAYQWASIECSPPAHYPEVLYTWYKNDIYNFIRPELKPYIMISHDGRLYFSEVTTDDIGQYHCLVYKPGQTLSEGKVSMPTELKVIEGSPGVYEPQIGSGFPLVYPNSPKVGDNVRLECWASGTSRINALQYSWDKVEYYENYQGHQKERTVPLPKTARLSDHNRVITVSNIQLYDAGTYRCNVRRIHGQSTNKTVLLTLQAMPYFTVDLIDQYIDENTDLNWRCEAGGDPTPEYFWLRNGLDYNNHTIKPEDQGRVTVNNNVLSVLTVSSKDDGMYQCSAKNMLGTRYSTGQLAVLAFAPNFKKYPLQPNQFATEKGNTTMFCKPEAAPYPVYGDIIWYKDGSPLNPGETEASRIVKMQNGNLFMKNLLQSDAGRYKCLVSNPYGSADTTGNLTILSQTTMTQPPIDTNIKVNSTNFLHCVASYDPTLDVTYVWYQGEMLVEFERVYRLGENQYQIWYNPHFKRGSGVYYGGLYIMNAQHQHTGRYTCIVESSSGKIDRWANVEIYGPPSEPAGVFFDSSTVTTSSVLIQWKAAGDNGRPITSYVVEALNHWEGFWRILMTNVRVQPDESGTMRTNVTRLQADSSYQIRMRAENSMGSSPPSQPTEQFTTLSIPPDKYPDEVGGGGGKVGDLVITWKALPPWEWNGDGIGYRVFIKNRYDDEWDERIDVMGGESGRYVHLVGEDNYYLEYEIAVQAFNNFGEGPISPISIIKSAMGLPTIIAQNVRAQPFNATACLVHWEPVEDSREVVKGKLGGYRLSFWKECCESEEMAPRTTVEGQATEGLVIGLYPDTPYYFDVMVWNDAGNGPKSQYFIQRTLRRAPIDMPVEVKVKRKSYTSIHVEWRGVSTSIQEEPLEGYKVRLWPDGAHMKWGTDYESEKEVDLRINDLNPRQVYKLRVYAYSRGGMGTMSSPTLKFQLSGSTCTQASVLILLLCLLFSTLGGSTVT